MTDHHHSVSTAALPGDLIDIVLAGGPENLPDTLRQHRVPRGESVVKVLNYGGYEHFERDADGDLDGPVVFRWKGRTCIAE
jgi:hypothetical protein